MFEMLVKKIINVCSFFMLVKFSCELNTHKIGHKFKLSLAKILYTSDVHYK